MIHLKRFFYRYKQLWFGTQSRTVKYAFPALATSFALIGALAIMSDDASYVRLVADKSAVAENERIAVNVYANAHIPTNAVDIRVIFDQDQMEVIGIDEGLSVITIWAQDPYEADGIVYLQGGTFRKGFLGEHLIATVNLKAKRSGQARLRTSDVMFLAGDGTGNEVSVLNDGATELVVPVVQDEGELAVAITAEIETDIDGDGDVGLDDISAFMASWSLRTVKYDFNGDNRMNFTDFGIILADAFRN